MTTQTASRVAIAALVLAGLVGAPIAAPTQAEQTLVPLNDCVRTDNGDPVVTDFEMSPRVVRLAGGARTVTITVAAQDTGGPGPATGISLVSVSLGGYASGGGPGPHVTMSPVSDGVWRGTVRLVPSSGVGGKLWADVSFRDRAVQGSYWSPPDLEAAGFDPLLRIRDRTRPDTAKPVMTSLRLSRARVDTRDGPRRVVVRARLRDDASGVGRVTVETPVARTRLHLVRGTRRDGVWRGHLTVGQWVGSQSAALYVKVFDRVGFRRIYGRTALRDHGFPDHVTIVARRDNQAPLPTLASPLPTALDVRTSDASVPVRLHVVDVGSGTEAASAHLTTPDGTQPERRTALRLTSGTSEDGYWEGVLRLSRCSAATSDYVLAVRVRDVRGGVRTPTFATPTVAVTAGDRRLPLPTIGTVVGWDQPAVMRVAFTEDFLGISSASAVVRRTIFRPALTTTTVDGSWSCADATGTTTDCGAGPVRTADVTLADPPVTGAAYQVLLNPEHNLDVRDLAGNPFRRFEVYLGQCCDR